MLKWVDEALRIMLPPLGLSAGVTELGGVQSIR
jgi:hypothetical protein